MANTKTQGCSLGLGNGASPQVYTSALGVTDFQMGSSRNVISANTLASTSAEKVAGLLDNGNVQFNGKFQSAGDPAMVDLWDAIISGADHNWKVTFSDSPETTFQFDGFVSNYSHSVSADSIVTVSGTLEISGAIVDNLS